MLFQSINRGEPYIDDTLESKLFVNAINRNQIIEESALTIDWMSILSIVDDEWLLHWLFKQNSPYYYYSLGRHCGCKLWALNTAAILLQYISIKELLGFQMGLIISSIILQEP